MSEDMKEENVVKNTFVVTSLILEVEDSSAFCSFRNSCSGVGGKMDCNPVSSRCGQGHCQ